MPSPAPRSRAPGRSRAEGPEGGSAVHDAASTHFLAPRNTAAPPPMKAFQSMNHLRLLMRD